MSVTEVFALGPKVQAHKQLCRQCLCTEKVSSVALLRKPVHNVTQQPL